MDESPRPEDISLPPSPPLEGDELLHRLATAAPTSVVNPETPRRSISPLAGLRAANTPSPALAHIRAHSPSSKGHLRSHSSAASVTLPPMQRAHSSPGVDSTGRVALPLVGSPHRSSSPSGISGRRRSPLRSAVDEYPGIPTWSGISIEPNIPEHAELQISSTPLLNTLSTMSEIDYSSHSPSAHNTFPRTRRRPTSPLHQSASAPTLHTSLPATGFASAGNSPLLTAQKYANEPYPSYIFGSASSMPSTPSSFRSRSPSISSLETIEDIPDAEEAAVLEAEEMSKLRAAAGVDDMEGKRRSSAFGSKKERKRWSVCGAERRADFSLEPIEE